MNREAVIALQEYIQKTEIEVKQLSELWRIMCQQNSSAIENQQNVVNEQLQNLRHAVEVRIRDILPSIETAADQLFAGPLREWRHKQKEAQCGLEMAENALCPAKEGFEFLAHVWTRVRYFFEAVANCGGLTPAMHETGQMLRRTLTAVMQRSMIMQIGHLTESTEEVERESISDSETVERRWIEDPPLVVRTTCEDNICVRVNFLSLTPEINSLLETVEPVLLYFIKSPNELSLNEETARNLQRGVEDENVMPAGTVTEKDKRPLPTGRPGTVGTMPKKDTYAAQFENMILVLRTGKRRGASSTETNKEEGMRNKFTKYHLVAIWKMNVDQSMGLASNGQRTQLASFCTISPPFMMRVARSQDVKLFGQMFWDVISCDKDSVTYQPKEQVPWSRLEKGLKYLFKKLTRVRELSHQEMKHLGKRLFGTQEGKVDPEMSADRDSLFHKKMMRDTEGKRQLDFSFFDWYYDAAELIIDRGVAIARTKCKPGNKNTDERKMASLFDQGVIQGFLSRPRAEKILRKSAEVDKVAAMLIRFSDHHPGHLTVSYIYVGRQPQHIRPLGRSFLTGLTLPSVVAMLIQINDIEKIFVGYTGDKNNRRHRYESKQRLVVGHLFNTVEYYENHYEAPGFQMSNSSGDTLSTVETLNRFGIMPNQVPFLNQRTDSVLSGGTGTPSSTPMTNQPMMWPGNQFMMPPQPVPQPATLDGVSDDLLTKLRQYSTDPKFMNLLYNFENEMARNPSSSRTTPSTFDQLPAPNMMFGGGRNSPLSGASTPGYPVPSQTPAGFMPQPNPFPMHQQHQMCFNRPQMCPCPSCQQSPFGFDQHNMQMPRPMMNPNQFQMTNNASPSPSPLSRSNTPAVDFFQQPPTKAPFGQFPQHAMYPPMFNRQASFSRQFSFGRQPSFTDPLFNPFNLNQPKPSLPIHQEETLIEDDPMLWGKLFADNDVQDALQQNNRSE